MDLDINLQGLLVLHNLRVEAHFDKVKEKLNLLHTLYVCKTCFMLFSQPGPSVRDAITQFNYHVEFSSEVLLRTAAGILITHVSVPCHLSVSWLHLTSSSQPSCWTFEALGSFYRCSERFFKKHDQPHLQQVLHDRGCNWFHLCCQGSTRKTNNPQS